MYDVEPKYYADGEDAYAMKRDLVAWSQEQGIEPAEKHAFMYNYKPDDNKDEVMK